ncbi:hypothetical protein [Paenibacillus sp. R14(2021)]|uniref:hypothetical protein n=1 Tax=Paenibacillus sp. R14(2021) TaxID=2859228 RepID=UPI001C613424|nr:hypothetical protein [Paenibacillus sp. R14(2021)]
MYVEIGRCYQDETKRATEGNVELARQADALTKVTASIVSGFSNVDYSRGNGTLAAHIGRRTLGLYGHRIHVYIMMKSNESKPDEKTYKELSRTLDEDLVQIKAQGVTWLGTSSMQISFKKRKKSSMPHSPSLQSLYVRSRH